MIDPLYLYVDSYSPVAIPLIIFIVQKLFQPDWFTVYMIKLSIPNFYQHLLNLCSPPPPPPFN